MKRRAKITALGRYVPPQVLTNYDLSKMVETSHEWIFERTGIVERHVAEKGTPTSELGAHAVADLLQRRGIEADEIDLIIFVTVTPDMFFSFDGVRPPETKFERRAPGALIFPRRVPAFFMASRPARNLSKAARTRRCWWLVPT
ncbi:MAG: hypothetical protein WKF84_00865 [Pyrinomonadaceae bacterium]